MRRARLLASAGATLVALVAAPSSARADDKAACVAASEDAQQLRSEGKLLDAREKLLACVRDACPAIVRKDCSDWLGEVDRSIPSVVPSAKDAGGHDVVAAQMFVDGRKVAAHLDGRAVAIDPGAHVLRFDAATGQSVEERVIVREGERNRPIIVLLGPSGAGGTHRAAATDGAAKGRTGVSVASIVLAGVGVAALGSFAYFGVTGRSKVDDLRATCAPNCSATDVDAARTKLIVADVSLGVGVVSLAVAAVLYFTRSDGDAASARGGLGGMRVGGGPLMGGGGAASLAGSF